MTATIGSYSLGAVIALIVLLVCVVLIVLTVAGLYTANPLLLLALIAFNSASRLT